MRAARRHSRTGRLSTRSAWLLSLGAHAVLVLVVVRSGWHMRSGLRASTPQPDTIEIEIASPAPPAPAPAPVAAQPSASPPPPVSALAVPARPAAPRRAPAPVTPAAPGAPAASVPAPPAASAGPGALAMRARAAAPVPGERQPGLPGDLSPAHAARLVAPDPGPPPYSPLDLPGPPPEQPDVRDDWMPAGGGTYAVDSPGFSARIARDGRVTIDDKPSFQVAPGMPRVVNETVTDPSTGEEQEQSMLKMDIATFDLTDWIMRMSGMDPYASAKLRLLDRTRDVRAEMRARARTEDLRDAIALLPRLLHQIWHDPGLPAAERREILFRIWDECAELDAAEPGAPGSDDQDGELARASRTARATVLGFIRRTLPAGSPDAYTAAELDALNARRKSAERFAPYP